jgi:ribonuclease E
VSSAVADFDDNPSQHPVTVAEPQSVAPPPEQHQPDRDQQQPARTSEPENAHEAERAGRRRSTVREKVSFPPDTHSAAPVAANSQSSEPSAAPAAANQSEPAGEALPRRAGWWSRRFGSGE